MKQAWGRILAIKRLGTTCVLFTIAMLAGLLAFGLHQNVSPVASVAEHPHHSLTIVGPHLAVSNRTTWFDLTAAERDRMLRKLAMIDAHFNPRIVQQRHSSLLTVNVTHSLLSASPLVSHVQRVGTDPQVVTTYGAFANPFNIAGPLSTHVDIPCVSSYGVTACSGVASAGLGGINPAEGSLSLGTAAFGVATAEADDWLGALYSSHAPPGVSSQVSVTATISLEDMAGGLSGIGVSCAPTYLNSSVGLATSPTQQSQTVTSCLNSLGVSIPVVDATEADPLAARAFTTLMDQVGNATSVQGIVSQWPSHNTETITWSGTLDGGNNLLIEVDPQVYAADSGAGTEVHALNALVSVQVTESYQSPSPVSAEPCDVGQACRSDTSFPWSGYTTIDGIHVTQGQLPPGLSLSLNPAGTGFLLVGTPSTVGTYHFILQAIDSQNQRFDATVTASVNPAPAYLANPSSESYAEVGVPYTQAVTAIDGTPPYTRWAVTQGRLPPGMRLQTGPGGMVWVLGTPTQAGTYLYALQVTDSVGDQGYQDDQQIIVKSRPILTGTSAGSIAGNTTTLPPAEEGQYYHPVTFDVSGGVAPYQWHWGACSGTLPPGLTLSPNGVLEGTPTQPGTYCFAAWATDGNGVTATAPGLISAPDYTLVVHRPLTWTTPSLPPAEIGAPYHAALQAQHGIKPYSWGLESASLPPGLHLNSVTGIISGVPTGPAGCASAGGDWQYLPNFVVSDALQPLGAEAFPSHALTLTVYPDPCVHSVLPVLAPIGQAYSGFFGVAAGTGVSPFHWTITGKLPAGLSWHSVAVTGQQWASRIAIIGTPTAAATNTNITVRMTDGAGGTWSQSFPVGVPVALVSGSAPGADWGAAYRYQAQAGGGNGGPYILSLIAGTLPPGLRFDPATGYISGTPTVPVGLYPSTPRSYAFILQAAANSRLAGVDVPAQGQTVFTIVVSPPPTVTTTALPLATIGQGYQAQLSARGGTAPDTWAVVAGKLPAGLSLNPATGEISGTPTASAVTRSFTVAVTDRWGETSRSSSLTLPVTLAILTRHLPLADPGAIYHSVLAAGGGIPPYHWAWASGCNVPPWLTLTTSGILSGQPGAEAAGQSLCVPVAITDASGQTATSRLTLTVATAIRITAPPISSAEVGIPADIQETATGGIPPYVWTIAHRILPPGLSLTPSGAIRGTPTRAGSWSVTLAVADSEGQTVKTPVTVNVAPRLTFTQGILTPPGCKTVTIHGYTAQVCAGVFPPAEIGVPYSFRPEVSGGLPPYVWTVLPEAPLPSGLTVDPQTGHVSGIPREAIGCNVMGTSACHETVALVVTDQLGAHAVLAAGTQDGAEPFVLYPRLRLIPDFPTNLQWTSPSFPTGESPNSLAPAFNEPASGVPYNLLNSAILTPNMPITVHLVAVGGDPAANDVWSVVQSPANPVSFMTFASGPHHATLVATTGNQLLMPGIYNGQVTVTDGLGGTAMLGFSNVTLWPSNTLPLRIVTPVVPPAIVDAPYFANLFAIGGNGPYRWSWAPASGSAMPPGLSLNPQNGTVTGLPTHAGSYTVIVTATDSFQQIQTQILKVVVSPGSNRRVTRFLGESRDRSPMVSVDFRNGMGIIDQKKCNNAFLRDRDR